MSSGKTSELFLQIILRWVISNYYFFYMEMIKGMIKSSASQQKTKKDIMTFTTVDLSHQGKIVSVSPIFSFLSLSFFLFKK